MDRESIERADHIPGAFHAVRYNRPDIVRDPQAYMSWLIGESDGPGPGGGLHPLRFPMIEDVYTIGPAAAPAETRWHIVVTEPGKESSVSDDLRRDGHETYMPERKFWRRRSVRAKTKLVAIERPLLPRYLFAGFAPGRSVMGAVQACRHAADVLCRSGSPAVIPAAEIEALRDRERAGEFDETAVVRKGWGKGETTRKWQWIKPGAVLHIIAGPFAGSTATVTEVDAGRMRARVEIGALGRMQVDFAQLVEDG